MSNCNDCGQQVNPCTSSTKQYQIDAAEVFYKSLCDKVSNLTDLDIDAGDTLETILEKFGVIINNFTFLSGPDIEDHPELATFEAAFEYLDAKLTTLTATVATLNTNLSTTNNNIANLAAKINSIYLPRIDDNLAKGFEKEDNIFKVLQVLSDTP